MHPHFPQLAWRSWAALGGFLALLLLEQLLPFKPPVDSRLARYARNIAIMLSNELILEVTLAGTVVAYTAWLSTKRIGLFPRLGLSPAANVLLSLPLFDLATWAFHWCYHNLAPMWRLHRVHHSDLDLDVTSSSRFHVGEILLSTVYRMAVMTLWGPSLAAVAVFEASLLFFSQEQHSNLRLPRRLDEALRWLFVTPDMHRVHHSMVRSHTNSNYSTIFSVWDRLFGTYNVDGIDQGSLRIGLPEYPSPSQVTLGLVLTMPFGPACADMEPT